MNEWCNHIHCSVCDNQRCSPLAHISFLISMKYHVMNLQVSIRVIATNQDIPQNPNWSSYTRPDLSGPWTPTPSSQIQIQLLHMHELQHLLRDSFANDQCSLEVEVGVSYCVASVGLEADGLSACSIECMEIHLVLCRRLLSLCPRDQNCRRLWKWMGTYHLTSKPHIFQQSVPCTSILTFGTWRTIHAIEETWFIDRECLRFNYLPHHTLAPAPQHDQTMTHPRS